VRGGGQPRRPDGRWAARAASSPDPDLAADLAAQAPAGRRQRVRVRHASPWRGIRYRLAGGRGRSRRTAGLLAAFAEEDAELRSELGDDYPGDDLDG